MKVQLLAAVAVASLGVSGAASAAEVQIRHAIARVVVLPEARSDISYEIRGGRADLPKIQATHGLGGELILDGGLGQPFFHNCSRSHTPQGQVINVMQPPADLRVRVDGHELRLADAPLIVLHTPKDVHVRAGDAVFGAVGRADSVELGSAGCGDWTVADVSGRLTVEVAGSGDVHAGRAGTLTAKIGGSGDVTAESSTNLDASIAGSGDVWVRHASGEVRASIAGSGDVRVGEGRASLISASIAGSGDVKYGGEAERVDAHIVGSGDVRVKSVKGGMESVHKSVVGSGSVVVGG